MTTTTTTKYAQLQKIVLWEKMWLYWVFCSCALWSRDLGASLELCMSTTWHFLAFVELSELWKLYNLDEKWLFNLRHRESMQKKLQVTKLCFTKSYKTVWWKKIQLLWVSFLCALLSTDLGVSLVSYMSVTWPYLAFVSLFEVENYMIFHETCKCHAPRCAVLNHLKCNMLLGWKHVCVLSNSKFRIYCIELWCVAPTLIG